MSGDSKLPRLWIDLYGVRLRHLSVFLIFLICLLSGSGRAAVLQYFEVDGTGFYNAKQCTGYNCGVSGRGSTESGDISAIFAFDPSLYASTPNGYTATLGGPSVTNPWLSLISASINSRDITGILTRTLDPPPGSYVSSFNIQQAQTPSINRVNYATILNYQSNLYNDPSSPLGGFQFGDQTVLYSADTAKELSVSTSTLNINGGNIVAGLPFVTIHSQNGDLFLANVSASVNQQEVYGVQATILSSKLIAAPPPPPPSPPPSYLYVTLNPTIDPSKTTSQPIEMQANATVATSPPSLPAGLASAQTHVYQVPGITLPAGTQTLQQAATDLHLAGFDWVQQITNWVHTGPQGMYAASDPGKLHPISTAGGPFYDPIPGGSLSVPNPYAANPYYLDWGAPISDMYSVAANTNDNTTYPSSTACAKYAANQPSGSTLCFGDEPDDPELSLLDISMGKTSKFPAFKTQLVGVCIAGVTPTVGSCNAEGYAPLFSWTWMDSYNGGYGEISNVAVGAGDGLAYPGGSGGITILSVNGTPVPEPSSMWLLLTGIVLFSFASLRSSLKI